MKKYKLNTDVFEGFNLGEIIYSHNGGAQYGKEKAQVGDKCISYMFIENMPSLFEEVKEEPNYVITSFIGDNDIIRKVKSNGMYSADECSTEWLLESFTEQESDSLVDGRQRIYSVKNSKGFEWTIGDEWLCDNEWFTIKSFETEMGIYGKLIMTAILHGGGIVAIDELEKTEKPKNPIFVSADGVELFKNNIDNILYSVLPKENWNETTNRVGFLIKIQTKEWLHFYTKEARQEYIDNNKPKYSLKDIKKSYLKAMCIGNTVGFMSELNKLSK